MAVIAMTREMATLGKDVTSGLAERLGIEVVHHELVEHDIAERSGMRESEVHRFLEGEASLISRWRIDRHKMSRYTAQEVLELAAKGNVLIRGWGATYLLRSVPHVVNVRICAPMRFRMRVLMKRLGIADPAAAQREIERNDAAHNGTMQRMFGIEWMDASLYAVTLNTARIPTEDCVEHIVQLCESEAFRETEQSRTELMDQLIEVRVRSMLDRHFAANLHVVGIDVRVKDKVVVLSGAISDENLIAEIVRKVHGVDGVARVESQIRYLAFARGIG
ncbi:MAG: cytidylate kinase-like family protein [Hyphomicrobiaceae bacterium]